VIQKARNAVIDHASAVTIGLLLVICGGVWTAAFWVARVETRLQAMEDCAQRLTALEAIVGTRVTHPPPSDR
jgi:hypothetical protein